MSRRNKRLEKIRRNPKNVSFETLQTVLLSFGFELDRITGSHHIFVLEVDEADKKVLTVPFRRPLKQVYVKQAIHLIDRYVLGDDNDES